VKIGIVGGTGDIGEGMALRLSPFFDVTVGSREKEKADKTCSSCINTLQERGVECTLSGQGNQACVEENDVVILAVPFRNLETTITSVTGFEGKIVICPVNPMEKRDYFVFVPPPEGSAALLAKRLLPPTSKLCSAFNTIAANKWRALDEELEYSVPVTGDDDAAKRLVMGIVDKVSKLHAFDAGPLAASSMVESLTPLLLNIARYNRMRDVGIQFR